MHRIVSVRSVFMVCAIAWVLAASPTSLWAQAQPAPLFVEVAQPALADAAPDNTLDRTAVRSRAINVDFSQLAGPGSALDAGSSLLLNLFPDATYTAVLDRIDRSADTV